MSQELAAASRAPGCVSVDALGFVHRVQHVRERERGACGAAGRVRSRWLQAPCVTALPWRLTRSVFPAGLRLGRLCGGLGQGGAVRRHTGRFLLVSVLTLLLGYPGVRPRIRGCRL